MPNVDIAKVFASPALDLVAPAGTLIEQQFEYPQVFGPNFHSTIKLNEEVLEQKAGSKFRIFSCGHANSSTTAVCGICHATQFQEVELQ